MPNHVGALVDNLLIDAPLLVPRCLSTAPGLAWPFGAVTAIPGWRPQLSQLVLGSVSRSAMVGSRPLL